MDNRTRIIQCAIELFSLRGYDAVGVQEIAETAGVTKPTLYYYFDSKRGLLDAILSEGFRALVLPLDDAACYRGDLPLTLEKITRTYFAFARNNAAFYRMHLAMWFAPQHSDSCQAVASYARSHYDIIEKVFLLASEDHGNMKGRHRAYAATFTGMLNTYIGLWLNGHVELNNTLIHQALHQYMHGIFS